MYMCAFMHRVWFCSTRFDPPLLVHVDGQIPIGNKLWCISITSNGCAVRRMTPPPLFVPLQLSFLSSQTRSREERGVECIDFGEDRTPFQLQILARVQALEVSDDIN